MVAPAEHVVSGDSTARHYNPGWLSDGELVANFIARQRDFAFLRDELASAPLVGSVQHHLLVGQRGAGKTTLLRRLAVAVRCDADLKDHLIELSFPEELYQVKNVADFWWAACEALAEALDARGDSQRAEALYTELDRIRATPGAMPETGLDRLLAVCTAIHQRPVLLVDNLDAVIQSVEQGGRDKHKGPASNHYWALREALSTTTAPIVIGASMRLSEPFTDYDKAFYDFFAPLRLGKLPLSEVRSVLEHLADRAGSTDIKTRLSQRPARIETLYELTGGNPRAVGLIFELLRQGPNGRAVDDFERLMDLTTPYYKARFEDLPKQAQVVMHALAVQRPNDGDALRFGATAAEIAAHTGLPTNTVSAQIDVLDRESLVEKSSAQGRKQYRIAEQLFRLWLQMRGTRRVRQNVIGLAEFLEAWFDREELVAQLQDAPGRGAALLSFAVAATQHAEGLKRGLTAHGADQMLTYARGTGEPLGQYFADGDLPEDIQALVELRRRLADCHDCGLDAEEQNALLGSVTLSVAEKAESVTQLCGAHAAAKAARLRPVLAAERNNLLASGLEAEDLPLLYRLRTRGQLPLPLLRPDDADAAVTTNRDTRIPALIWRIFGAWRQVQVPDAATAEAWLNWGQTHAATGSSSEWANAAGTLRRAGYLNTAERALAAASKRGESARTWFERGAQIAPTDPTGAEAAYRCAIALDAKDALPWYNLGNLLAAQAGRAEEAEAAYRRAIALDAKDAWPWNSLGYLLAAQAGRAAEAEAAFRRAIELDAKFAQPWNNLGNLLADQAGRAAEAEAAYRRAIALDAKDALPWNNLGILLADQGGRAAEAEAAYRRAIELDSTYGRPWGHLGRLFESGGRFDAALAAYEQAMALDSKFTAYWRQRRNDVLAATIAGRAHKALLTEGAAAARSVLTELAVADVPLPALLATGGFETELLIPALAKRPLAADLLRVLRELGFDRHARPLLLAFEAALEDRPAALDTLEPELRTATQQIYARLTAKVQKHSGAA